MDGWNKIASSLANINVSGAGSKLSKGFSSSVQATKERLGQIAPEDITELPQEYKDLETRVDALRAAHISLLNLPCIRTRHSPHALARAATSAATVVAGPGAAPHESGDKLGKALALYANGWERIAGARLDQDDAIATNFLAPWQQTLNTSISLAMKARQAVRVSRLKTSNPSRQEHARLEVENAEDDLVQKTEVAITLMKTVLENPEPIKNLNELAKAQLLFFSSAAEALSSVQGEIEELSVAAEGEYSLRREVFVLKRSPSGGELTTEEQVGYGIASVYTPPEKRRKGYAKHMMSLLHWVLGPASSFPSAFPEVWGQPPAVPEGFGSGIVSVLYSDIGPTFYKASGPAPGVDGWTVDPYTVSTWDVKAVLERTKDEVGKDQWTLLNKEQTKEWWNQDSELILREVPSKPQSSTSIAFTFLPRKGVAEFLHRRIEWFVNSMERPPPYYGALLSAPGPSDGEPSSDAFASWTFELYPGSPKTLLITRLRCPKEELLRSLLGRIAEYASDLEIERIQVRNLPGELNVAGEEIGGATVHPEDHLPSVKWYRSGPIAEWLYNEKFAWC
ncbi:hypothetical protein H1R20_g2580, partial [Candolleomyces eurysporus]